jgi:hypothetical protein
MILGTADTIAAHGHGEASEGALIRVHPRRS